jgi:hypothetical protein
MSDITYVDKPSLFTRTKSNEKSVHSLCKEIILFMFSTKEFE